MTQREHEREEGEMHTTGPWTIADSTNPHEAFAIEGKDYKVVAWVANSWDEANDEDYVGEEDEANANLIAVAPDLLKALEELLDEALGCEPWWINHSGQDFIELCQRANRAIAKAKGGRQ